MPNKRRNRSAIVTFLCPYCERRLWRLGSQKHHLFYQGAQEIAQQRGLSQKKAALLATQGVYVDRSAWLEEFMCGEDGMMWMYIKQSPEGNINSRLAEEHDWQRTSGTLDPNTPNASVSEFTYKMSRQTSQQLRRFYNH